MAYRRFIPIAVLLVLLVTALATGQGKPPLSHAEAAPFIGTWLFTLLGVQDPGFRLFGVNLIPAFIGAVVIAVALQLFSHRRPLG